MRAGEVVDEATAFYAIAAQACFDNFHGAANRMAGLLVLLAITKSRHVLDLDVQRAAAAMVTAGTEQLRALVPTRRSKHFHRHLDNAGRMLIATLDEINRTLSSSAAARDPLSPLRIAWDEIRNASKCLPGFEVVDFGHSCCALHQIAAN